MYADPLANDNCRHSKRDRHGRQSNTDGYIACENSSGTSTKVVSASTQPTMLLGRKISIRIVIQAPAEAAVRFGVRGAAMPGSFRELCAAVLVG